MATFKKKEIRCLADDMGYIPGAYMHPWKTIPHQELGIDDLYDSCFLQAISESDMHECHQQYYRDYLDGKRERMIMRCCTQHYNFYFIYKRTNELYEELKNGNTKI